MTRWLVLIAGLTAGCAAYASPALPTAPQGAELVRDEPIPCPDGSTFYLHAYDTNPVTQAADIFVGPTLNGQHEHGDPFLVVRVDDAGTPIFYLLTESGIKIFTAAEWTARFGDISGTSVCLARTEKQT
jgi:hypothetical protein